MVEAEGLPRQQFDCGESAKGREEHRPLETSRYPIFFTALPMRTSTSPTTTGP